MVFSIMVRNVSISDCGYPWLCDASIEEAIVRGAPGAPGEL
jgi:hypothetical protein